MMSTESVTLTTFKFAPGRMLMTPGAVEAMQRAKQKPSEFLGRHLYGDWGDVDASDSRANETALKNDLRILSSYKTAKGDDLWVITEHDRSVTTILLPSEY